MFSFGIEPSITSTNGASSSSSTAWRNGLRNSSPPSVGDSTLLCRCTFGRPGIAPSRTSSMLGSEAAVTEIESPSQLIPSEIHRMWTSSTPCAASAVLTSASAPRKQLLLLLLQLQRVHEQLVAAPYLHVQRAARSAVRREPGQLRFRPARAAVDRRRHLLHHQLRALHRRALGHELERELERRRHHLPQVPDLQLHARPPAPIRVSARDLDDGVR